MGPEGGLAAPKRKFYRLLENLSRSNVDKSKTDSTDAENINDGGEPSLKRSKVLEEQRVASPPQDSRPLSMASATSTIAPGLSGDTGYERPSVRILATAFEARKKQQNEQPLSPPTPVEKLPAHSPSSQEQFLQRLKTFSDIWVWTPKPRAIGEVAWARVGWSALNDGKARDTVICLACGERVVVRLTRDPDSEEKEKNGGKAEEDGETSGWWDGDIEKDLVVKYKSLIKNGHGQDCLWRKFYCPSDIYQIDMADPNKWQSALRERYFSLTPMDDVLPDKVIFPEYEGDDERRVFDLEKLINDMPDEVLQLRRKQQEQSEKEDATPGSETVAQVSDGDATRRTQTTKHPMEPYAVNRKAFALAICGWHGQSTSGVNLAYCKHCFQRCGLWLYRASETSNKSTTSLHDASEPMSFNPVDLHREHCPWKNVRSQSEKAYFKGLAAWQVQAELLRRWLPPKKIKTPQEIEAEVDMETNDADEPLVVQTWQEAEEEERQLESKLRRLKRMFTVKKADKRLSKRRSRVDIQSRGTTASRPGTGAE